MYPTMFGDSRLFQMLFELDEVVAEGARREGCRCGGVLHRAAYERKPRGGPVVLGDRGALRFSFCCARDGCRRRTTPPSLRFLGRKVFLGVVVLLGPVLSGTARGTERRDLQASLGVSRRTLRRWARWWRETFPSTPQWAAASARFATPVSLETMPGSLLDAFVSSSAEGRVIAALALVAGLTTEVGVHAL